jgi:hypothetical protein
MGHSDDSVALLSFNNLRARKIPNPDFSIIGSKFNKLTVLSWAGKNGGRGIKVCDEWRLDFFKFYDWLTTTYPNWKELFDLGYQLDRINVDGNYEPGNVRLVTYKENNRNKRDNIYIEYLGQKYQLLNLYESLNSLVGYETFKSRIRKGWSVEDAYQTPPGKRKNPNAK